jgi:hypothetical protein
MAVLFGKSRVRTQTVPEIVSDKDKCSAACLVQLLFNNMGQVGLARTGKASKPAGNTSVFILLSPTSATYGCSLLNDVWTVYDFDLKFREGVRTMLLVFNFKFQNIIFYWRARQDSNLRPTDSKSGALSS